MFKWPDVPIPTAEEHELADFAELLCWQEGNTSATALARALERRADYDHSRGVEEDEEIPRHAASAYREIERRTRICGEGYPFLLGRNGDTLSTLPCTNNSKRAIYRYLLLATRMNMSSNRRHADIDGTQLFEELSAETCKEYFGSRAECMVFGTPAGGTRFEEKVNRLCTNIQEGDGFHPKVGGKVNEKDGKLDVVVWKHFSDGLPGKFIAFGQCKTGTNSRDHLALLKPDSFCKKWMRSSPALTPMQMSFVAEALQCTHWYNFASDFGLLFDRCRIVDFSNQVSCDVLARVKSWTSAAAVATGLAG